MLYGRWNVDEAEAEIADNQLVAIRYAAEPEEPHPGQGFEFLGSMSEMISRNFLALTSSDEGSVERFSPKSESISLSLMIPEDYKGTALPLWRFTLQPVRE